MLDSSIRWLRLPLAKSSLLKLRANNDSVKRFRESIQSEERAYEKVSEVWGQKGSQLLGTVK